MYYSEKYQAPITTANVKRLFGVDPVNDIGNRNRIKIFPLIEAPEGFSVSHYVKENSTYIAIPNVVSDDQLKLLNVLSKYKVNYSTLVSAYGDPEVITVYEVTVSSGKFYINGALVNTLTLLPGKTYRFYQHDSSNATHFFRFSTTADGTHGSGTEYTTGVTTSGTPGTDGYTQIVVAADTPTLYYYCTQHSGMGGTITT